MFETVSQQLSCLEYHYTIKQTGYESEYQKKSITVAIILINYKILLTSIKSNV